PRGENRIWVGSTVEEVGFQDGVTPEGRIELLEATRAVLPDVDDGRVERLWSGLRPKAMRRGGPYLGRWPGVRNLWVACGHYRSGILLGPLSGRLVARNLLEDRPLDEEFSVAGREVY
ncbi:MAG: FAD-dependent oxidoreductase, partial [Planctomycetota bacterium]|nr:FAD-dependent oxidoreductase [Planctomycetota bacterium]